MTRRKIMACVVLAALLGGGATVGRAEQMFGPTGIFGELDNQAKTITVTKVDPKSPADGKLAPDMVIVGAFGAPFKAHVRRELAEAIDRAETEAGKGILVLDLKNAASSEGQGAANPVELQLDVLGAYSETAPYDCPKSAAILKRAEVGGPSWKNLTFTALAQMASQTSPPPAETFSPPKPDKLVTKVSEWNLRNRIYITWRDGYALIADCERFLRDPDEALFDRIRSSAINFAAGQDAGGLYGHQLATPERNGRLPGYAQMNQPSLTILIGMLLARKCGVEDPLLIEAIERTHAFYASFIGRGAFNYGVHGPNTATFNNNGTSATAAIAMALHGDQEGARFFAKLSSASYNTLETGHGGHFFNVFWTPLGTAVGGPELTSEFFKKARWLYTMYRRWDGSFVFEGETNMALAMPYALANRSLMITGRDADESIWITGQAARDTAAAGDIDYAGKSTAELIALARHELPQVVRGALWTLNAREDYTPDIGQWLANGTNHQKKLALSYVGHPKPPETGKPYIDEIAAVLRDTEEDAWLRAQAARTLAYIGEPARKHYMDLVAFVAEERPWDRFGDIDWDVGGSIVTLSRTPFTSNLVTDKDLFYKAALKLIGNRRQHARGDGLRMLQDMPPDDFHIVGHAVMHEVKDEDPGYHSYHGKNYISEAIGVLARARVREGLDYALALPQAPDGKHSFKMFAMFRALERYGAHARPILEAHEEEWNRWATHRLGRRIYPPMVKAIQQGEPEGELRSFEEAMRTRSGQ